jgi:hypothetical protein
MPAVEVAVALRQRRPGRHLAGEPVGGHRAGVQEALRPVAADDRQRVAVGFGLDALWVTERPSTWARLVIAATIFGPVGETPIFAMKLRSIFRMSIGSASR